MNPNLGLLAASGLANFLLRTTAEWLVCWLLARLLRSAQSRFNVWLAMLLGFAAQWVWLGVNICRAAFPGHVYAARGVQTGAIAPAGTRIALTENTAGTVAQAIAILLVAYFVVLVWRILGSAAARVRLGRAMRYKNAPASELETTFQEVLQHSSQLRNDVRECKLWVLPGLPSPATLGWLRPQVLLPATWNAQDPAELRVVFWHELKHVERRDALWSAMVRGCRTLLWFHPCVHHAAAALDAERELACDAAVVSEHPHSRDVYATCLVRLARQRDLAAASAVAGIEMASGAALLSARYDQFWMTPQGRAGLHGQGAAR
jgi:beta-lactamase regulating signal transducer with metallopeptidase domain